MTKEELIKYCRYYKGEDECPFDRMDDRGTFWSMENTYVTKYSVEGWEENRIAWERKAERYMQEHPDEENIITSKEVSIHTKGIAMYVDAMLQKWCPYDTDLILKYDVSVLIKEKIIS